MKTLSSRTVALTAVLLGSTNIALADSYYVTAMIGGSDQTTDSEPYGNNIAVDPDFPGKFDSGDGNATVLALGYAYNDNFDIELRLGLRKSDFNSRKIGTGARAGEEYILDGDIASTTLTVEAVYEFSTASSFTPYLKGGIGVSHNEYSARLGGAGVAGFDAFDGTVDGFYDAYADKSSNEFTWNLGLGASVAITETLSLVGEFQVLSLGDAQTGQDAFTDGFGIESTAQEVLIGLRAQF